MTAFVYASQAEVLERAWHDVVIAAGIDVQTRGRRCEVHEWMADAGGQRLVERGALSRQGGTPLLGSFLGSEASRALRASMFPQL